ncbi:MAG: molybdopterin-dependent oxidoreductase, partial [Deltaproteobacteria bacterium]|nr:molybdopterin-dependent oxidoreductase [Deltaproteobacteria bacterium]
MYTDDLVGRYAGALHAWPVMAPHAHAKVDGVDSHTGAARRDEPLFPKVVVYHGQAVCWVLAENEEQAKVGAAAVSVSYTKLDPIVGIEAAIAAGSFHTDPLVIQRGAPADAIAKAPHSLEGELAVGGQEHFYLETQAALAYIDEDGATFVHSSTQHPSETQEICARVLGIEKNAVTCQSLRMGGAFGGKEVQANPWAAVAVLGAHATGRPVRVRLDRQRDFQLTGKRHPFLGRYRVGFDDDGSIVGIDV